MRALHELKNLILDEIDKVTQKGDITPNELESMNYAADIIKDIDHIMGEDEGHSERGYVSYDNSYRRGRDARTGRYVSRDSSYDEMMSKLDRMRSNAPDERTRRMVDKWMDEAERY